VRVLGLILSFVVAAVAPPGAQAQDDRRLETDVKATFVFQFSRYAEWPAATMAVAQRLPFKVCSVADGGFDRSLDKVLEGETVAGRPMARVVPDTLQDARACQILFIGDIEPERVKSLLTSVERQPVLTVGDAPDFLEWGGQIRLVRDGTRVRFDINLPAARLNNIVLRSQLLRIARKVINDKERMP
jgi:hypothetical protein